MDAGNLSTLFDTGHGARKPRDQNEPWTFPLVVGVLPSLKEINMVLMSKHVPVTCAVLMAIALAGCSVKVLNTRPAQELAQQARVPGSVYAGWRVFQDKCASCHGPAANGTVRGPDLLPRVRPMVSRQFVSLVLQRYEWTLPAGQTAGAGSAREALLDDLDARKVFPMDMPAWQGEPRVTAHIADLYAYLSARAQGTQDASRPAQ